MKNKRSSLDSSWLLKLAHRRFRTFSSIFFLFCRLALLSYPALAAAWKVLCKPTPITSQNILLSSLASQAHFSLFSSLSKQYSRYRSAQRAVARQLYLKKRLKLQPLSRFHSTTLARPVRPKQRSFYPRRARVRPENLGQDEYDHSINEWAKKGEVVKQSGHQSKYGSGGRFSSWDSQKNSWITLLQ